MWYSLRITVHYGNGVHSITVSQKAFGEIRGGKEITLRGDGFATEEGIVPDYWEFNTDSPISKSILPQRKAIISR